MPSLSMVFDVLAIDRASAVFDRVGASATKAGTAVDAAMTTTSNAGKRIAEGLGLATAAAVALSVKMAGDFQQNVTKLATTAGEAQKNLGLVSKGMLDMSTQVGIGANDLAKGMYTVESAGFHGANALNVLKAAAQGARQEQADLGKTTDALTTILHDYNIPASQAADVMSKLVAAVSTGKTTLEEFSGSLHSVTPLAAALHVPLQDILGSLAAMTASGESADQATQNMADALRHLQSPTAGMTSELAQLGITAQDLSASLSTKGLAGTMQEVEQAILQHLDPATQRVLLPAFNQSKTAAADLAQMIGQMPSALAKLSQGLLDGSTNISDYRKAVRGMGGEAGAAGLQFLSLYQSSDGFNQILKAGGPAAQVFTSALQKAVGDSAGLTVALQLTGEHAATVNENIKKVAASSAEAGGNIKGWHEVQGNFNQQLAETGASLEKMAIELGQHLLPALSDGLHFVNNTAIPGIEHLGTAVGDAGHFFASLPEPVRNFALALAALRIADATGLLDRLGSTVSTVRTTFQGLRDEMAVQQALWAMNERDIGAAGQSYSELGSMLSRTKGSAEAAGAGATKLEGALGSLAANGINGAKAGLSGLVGLFGGPWGVAVAGAIAILPGLASGFELLTGHVIDAKAATQDFTSALQASNGAIDDSVRQNIKQQLTQSGVITSFQKAGVSAQDAIAGIEGNRAAQERVTQALQDYITTSIRTEGRNNQNAQSAVKARDAYAQLEQAFGTAGQQADYFTVGVGHTTTATGLFTGAIKALTNAINSMPAFHNTVITADTTPADNSLNAFLQRVQAKGFVGAVFNLNPAGSGNNGGNPIGLPPVPHKAVGGAISGPGSGTSDSILIAASNGEHMWTASEVSAAGGHGAVEAMRRAVLASGLGFAGGGPVPTGMSYPVDWNSSIKASLNQQAAQLTSFSGTGTGAGSPFIRILGQAIAATMGFGAQFGAIDYIFSHESGWNPMAQNPTSSAFGIPQFLNGTWAQYGGKTTDPAAQIRDGISYMRDRYGSPNAAAAFWQGHHWYHNGGVVPGPPSLNVPAVLKGGETVRTAQQEAALNQPTTFHIYDVDGVLLGTMHGAAADAFDMAHNRGTYNG